MQKNSYSLFKVIFCKSNIEFFDFISIDCSTFFLLANMFILLYYYIMFYLLLY